MDITKAILERKSPDKEFRKAWNTYYKENKWMANRPREKDIIKTLAIMNYQEYGTVKIQMAVDQYVEGLYGMALNGKTDISIL